MPRPKPTPNKWFQYILDHPEKPWDWREISRNPNVTWEIVQAYAEECPWDWFYLTHNPNITWAIVLATHSEYPWDYSALLNHPELDFEFVKANPTCVSEWFYISKHKNITWEIVQTNRVWNHPDKTKRKVPWSFRGLSQNPNVTMEILRANPKCNWSYSALLANPNLTWEYIKDHLDKPWDFKILSRHKIVTWEIIQQHPEIPWDWANISANPNITWDIVKANPDYTRVVRDRWNPEALSSHPNITLDIVKANWSVIRWNCYSLSSNPNITWDDIIANPEIFSTGQHGCFHSNVSKDPEEFTWADLRTKNDEYPYKKCMSYNPNLTWDIVEANPGYHWVWHCLSSNPMTEPVRKRQQARCALLKEEIVAAALVGVSAHKARLEMG